MMGQELRNAEGMTDCTSRINAKVAKWYDSVLVKDRLFVSIYTQIISARKGRKAKTEGLTGL